MNRLNIEVLSAALFFASLSAVTAETDVVAAIKRLSSPEDYNRVRAAHSLGAMGKAALPAYDALFSVALSDELTKVRRGAAEALGKIAKDKAVDAFIIQLKTNSRAIIREYAVDALKVKELRSPISEEPLFQALKDENDRVRAKAAFALQYYESDRLAERLLDSLKREDDKVREWAPMLLGRMKCRAALTPLHGLLDDEDPKFRRSVITALRFIPSETSVTPLVKVATQDEDNEVRIIAILCLGDLGYVSAGKPLLKLLSDPNLEIKGYAADAIGRLGIRDAKEPLRKMFKHGTPGEKLAAMGGLCLLDDREAIPLIVDAFETVPDQLIPRLVYGLLDLKAEKELRTLKDHKNKAISVAAHQALQKLERRNRPTNRMKATEKNNPRL